MEEARLVAGRNYQVQLVDYSMEAGVSSLCAFLAGAGGPLGRAAREGDFLLSTL